MRRVRILIVDDEPLAREGIALCLRGDREVEVIGTCADGRAAADEIRSKRPDLVFLDIQMPRMGGLEVLESLPREHWPQIVFISAYEKYAVRAFELCAVDYVLKPFCDARFRQALERAKERIDGPGWEAFGRSARALLERLRNPGAADGRAEDEPRPFRLAFRVGRDRVFVNPAEIAWMEAHGNSVRIAAAGQVHTVRLTLQAMQDRLAGAGRFLRIHRSFIVNADRIARIRTALYGDHVALMSDGARIPLSRTYRRELRELLEGDGSAAGRGGSDAAAALPEEAQGKSGEPET